MPSVVAITKNVTFSSRLRVHHGLPGCHHRVFRLEGRSRPSRAPGHTRSSSPPGQHTAAFLQEATADTSRSRNGPRPSTCRARPGCASHIGATDRGPQPTEGRPMRGPSSKLEPEGVQSAHHSSSPAAASAAGSSPIWSASLAKFSASSRAAQARPLRAARWIRSHVSVRRAPEVRLRQRAALEIEAGGAGAERWDCSAESNRVGALATAAAGVRDRRHQSPRLMRA